MKKAAGRLDVDFKELHPEFPIRGAVTMRNKLIHDYNLIDPQVVWDTLKGDIPELRDLCKKLLILE